MAFVCAFGASSPHPAPSYICPAVSVCFFLHAVFACSAFLGLLAPRLWLFVSLHLPSCYQTRVYSQHLLPHSPPCLQISSSISIYFVRALRFAPQEHILVPTEDPSLLPWPRCLSPNLDMIEFERHTRLEKRRKLLDICNRFVIGGPFYDK